MNLFDLIAFYKIEKEIASNRLHVAETVLCELNKRRVELEDLEKKISTDKSINNLRDACIKTSEKNVEAALEQMRIPFEELKGSLTLVEPNPPAPVEPKPPIVFPAGTTKKCASGYKRQQGINTDSPTPLRDAVLAVLKEYSPSPANTKQMAVAIFTTPGTTYRSLESCYGSVSSTCSKLEKTGILKRVAQGVYELIPGYEGKLG